MKSSEFITEGREAALYHYTSLAGFNGILSTNTLTGRKMVNQFNGKMNPNPTISFTRSYTRDFIPNAITARSIGFRVDQQKLTHRFKMYPTNQNPASHGPEVEKQLPQNMQDQIAKMRATGETPSYSMTYNGANVSDIAKGTVGQKARWESEEVVVADAIPNFTSYVTGIVLPIGSGRNATKSVNEYLAKIPTAERALILDTAAKLSVPIIWNKKEYSAEQLRNSK